MSLTVPNEPNWRGPLWGEPDDIAEQLFDFCTDLRVTDGVYWTKLETDGKVRPLGIGTREFHVFLKFTDTTGEWVVVRPFLDRPSSDIGGKITVHVTATNAGHFLQYEDQSPWNSLEEAAIHKIDLFVAHQQRRYWAPISKGDLKRLQSAEIGDAASPAISSKSAVSQDPIPPIDPDREAWIEKFWPKKVDTRQIWYEAWKVIKPEIDRGNKRRKYLIDHLRGSTNPTISTLSDSTVSQIIQAGKYGLFDQGYDS